nr:signal protein PDZ [Actinomycetales bacterium]
MRARRVDPGMVIFGGSAVLLMLALALMVVLPLPWMIRSPGPTLDTLSDVEGESLISIEGADTYATGDGQLRLTTISVTGGPGRNITLFDAVGGWLRPDRAVLPRELVYQEDQDPDELSDFQVAQMNASQEFATAAALQELGYELDMTLTVAELMPGLPAEEALEVEDVLTSIRPAGGEKTELSTFGQLIAVLAAQPPGTGVELEVVRADTPTTVTFETSPRPEGDDEPGSLLGVWLSTEVEEFPVEISFDIDQIGGPSAGMMFALAIVDLMTPGELTGGIKIAGSGTMSIDGRVGPIGGIQQKLHGALRDGATWFLVAEANCAEAIGNVPEGLKTAAVGTLGEAVAAVEAIADGTASALTSCETVLAQDA